MSVVSEQSTQQGLGAPDERYRSGEVGWPVIPATGPAGPPPPPPWGPGGYGLPRPEPPSWPTRYRLMVIGLIAAVVLALAGGLVAGVTVAHGWSRATASGNTDTSTGIAGGGANLPNNGGSVNASGIAAAIDPAVVDINTTLGLQQASAAGTGIVLTSTGEVLTNNHVISGATSITATDVGNGKTYQATVVGYDISEDLAVIKLEGASGLATAPIGDSSTVTVGDAIVAIGNAGGQGGTPAVATGTVTATDQAITASDENGANAEQLSGLIQIAADIQPGDSGGPLVNSSGKVIGMDTAATVSFRFQASGGQGYAIPINQAISVAKQIEAGKASDTIHIGATGFLGVEIAPNAGQGGMQTSSGAPLAGVVSGSPAEQAGLAAGDTIVSLNGTAVDSPTTLTNLLSRYHPGDQLRVGIVDQAGQSRTVTLKLATGPAA